MKRNIASFEDKNTVIVEPILFVMSCSIESFWFYLVHNKSRHEWLLEAPFRRVSKAGDLSDVRQNCGAPKASASTTSIPLWFPEVAQDT